MKWFGSVELTSASGTTKIVTAKAIYAETHLRNIAEHDMLAVQPIGILRAEKELRAN